MCGFVESSCPLWVAFRYGNGWVQHHTFEPADPVSAYFHHSLGTIGICGYGDPSIGGKMQIPEFVAGRQRRHEQLFWVPAGAVAPKSPSHEWLPYHPHLSRSRGNSLDTRRCQCQDYHSRLETPHSDARACLPDGLREITLPFDRERGMVSAILKSG